MNGICLVAGLLVAQFGDDITLRWTHSVQKTVWEEDYRRQGASLRVVAARVQGTGAGMEPPPDAVFREGAWHYAPKLPLLPQLLLTHSPHTAPYSICSAGRCQAVDAWLPGVRDGSVLVLRPCV